MSANFPRSSSDVLRKRSTTRRQLLRNETGSRPAHSLPQVLGRILFHSLPLKMNIDSVSRMDRHMDICNL